MMDPANQLALETIQINKQALVFCASRASAEKTAEDIAKLTNMFYPEFEKEILKAASTPTRQCRRLSHCIRKGIAFHHAGLAQKQKNLIEEEFRKGKIKIICCTPTLASGLSMPAFRVIIKSLKRYSGRWGMDWIPVLEYHQMSGRAGRPEYESFGEAISIAKHEAEKDEIYQRFVCGKPEDIYSKLSARPVLRTYLLSLISSGIIHDEKTMEEFFAQTFWAYQYDDKRELEEIMEEMLDLLEEWEFIKIYGSCRDYVENKDNKENNKNDSFVAAHELDKKAGKEKVIVMKPTLLGKRISELYLDPLTAKHLLDCLDNFDSSKSVFSLLQMICHTLEMRPLLRIKSKQQDFIQEELLKHYELLLEPEPSAFDLEYGDFMNSIKTALFFEAWINERDEDYLLEKFDIRPGEIRTKIENADWLLYAAEELAKIKENQCVLREVRKLRVRVKNGVKEELLQLLKLTGIGRVRGRRLYMQGIRSISDLKKSDITTLRQILGKTLAENIKKQLGKEIKEIPKGTRLGQLSIKKF